VNGVSLNWIKQENTLEFLWIGESLRRIFFAWRLGRVNRKLEGWKESLNSKAGKEILLKKQ